MTGAPMPAGADTVYPQEIVERSGRSVRVPAGPAGVNVRYRGEDVRAGVGRAGRGHRAAAAGAGRRRLARARRSSSCTSGRAWRSSPPATRSRSRATRASPARSTTPTASRCTGSSRPRAGRPPITASSPTCYDELHARLRAAAAIADVVITSGGVSVGDHDLVKEVLQDAGGIDFWQVAMQPGRPLAVGRIGTAHFFGLPGNPVASMLTFHLFVRPALWKLAGRRELFPPRFHAVAMEPMSKKPGRREFKRGHPLLPRRALGGAHHRAPGLRHPHLDDRWPTASS